MRENKILDDKYGLGRQLAAINDQRLSFLERAHSEEDKLREQEQEIVSEINALGGWDEMCENGYCDAKVQFIKERVRSVGDKIKLQHFE